MDGSFPAPGPEEPEVCALGPVWTSGRWGDDFHVRLPPPAEDVLVWEELLLLRPGLWRQSPVTATRAPGGKAPLGEDVCSELGHPTTRAGFGESG